MTITESAVLDVIRKRHPAPAWAFFSYVRNQTGYSADVRTADAIAMSLYPSRGLDLFGFEVKVDRGDWLRELKKPDKAEETMGGLDFIVLVTPPDVVETGEVPPKWGHGIVKGSRLKYVKAAERLHAEGSAIPRHFVASILRKAHETREATPGHVALRAAYENGRQAAVAQYGDGLETLNKAHKRAIESVQERISIFEKASGLTIDTWEAGNIGEAVRMLLRTQIDFAAIKKDLHSVRELSARCASDVEALLALCENVEKQWPKKGGQ